MGGGSLVEVIWGIQDFRERDVVPKFERNARERR
jgi:hypothetical protein